MSHCHTQNSTKKRKMHVLLIPKVKHWNVIYVSVIYLIWSNGCQIMCVIALQHVYSAHYTTSTSRTSQTFAWERDEEIPAMYKCDNLFILYLLKSWSTLLLWACWKFRGTWKLNCMKEGLRKRYVYREIGEQKFEAQLGSNLQCCMSNKA